MKMGHVTGHRKATKAATPQFERDSGGAPGADRGRGGGTTPRLYRCHDPHRTGCCSPGSHRLADNNHNGTGRIGPTKEELYAVTLY